MNIYAKKFIHRGLMFGGFGPVIAGVVFACIPAASLTGGQVLLAVVSTYLLTFIHAGASVFNQIDHWPMSKSLLCHFGSLYAAYSLCYVVNAWIPFEPLVLGVFTLSFAALYFLVWGIVYICVRTATKKMNAKL